MIEGFFIYCVIASSECFKDHYYGDVQLTETNCLGIMTQYVAQQNFDFTTVRIERIGCGRKKNVRDVPSAGQ